MSAWDRDVIFNPYLVPQQYVVSNQTIPFKNDVSILRCRGIWNSFEAQFEPCFVRGFSLGFPTSVTGVVILCLALKSFWRNPPQWSQRLVKEELAKPEDQEPNKPSAPYFAIVLVVISALGLGANLTAVFFPSVQLQALAPALCWLFAAVLISIYRPRKAPLYALLIYSSIALSQGFNLLDKRLTPGLNELPTVISLSLALAEILVIFNMPLRDQRLPKSDISSYLSPPRGLERTPEDNLTLFRFFTISWLSPLIRLAVKRQLNADDVWKLGYEFQHRLLHNAFRELKGTVLRRILIANFQDVFLILPLLAVLDLVLTFASPLLLQQLLQSLENPASSRRAAITYAFLSAAFRVISAQVSVLQTWYGRRAYERSRGEMITMLTQKTLTRKTVSTLENLEKPQNDEVNVPAPNVQSEDETVVKTKPKSLAGRVRHVWTNLSWGRKDDKVKETALKQVKASASTGRVLSLVRQDIYEVAQRFWEVDSVISIPLGLVFSVIVVSRFIGWQSCAVGIFTVLVFQMVNAFIARILLRKERERRISTDIKNNAVSQFVQGLRPLRWYGWQEQFLSTVFSARERELAMRFTTGMLRTAIDSLNMFANEFLAVATFGAYTILLGGKLRVDIAFPALALFGTLQDSLLRLPNLITVFLNARIALERIQNFMDEPDVSADDVSGTKGKLELQAASFAWPSDGILQPVLRNVTLSFPVGVTVIFGEVGAGKSFLLKSLLGETEHCDGEFLRPSSPLSYTAQSPWLQAQSIRDNIVFGDVWDEQRYKAVIEVCELSKDFVDFKFGDLTQIGESGIGLSGGQRARVSLARAIYNKSEYLLCDDPLSALDRQTGQAIANSFVHSPLLKNRRLILVTHRTDYFPPGAAVQRMRISDGTAHVVDLDAEIHKTPLAASSSSLPNQGDEAAKQKEPEKEAESFLKEEKRATGEVRVRVYWEYIKAGGLIFWVLLFGCLVASRGSSLLKSWYLKQFGESYKTEFRNIMLFVTGLIPDVDPETHPLPWLLGLFYIAMIQAGLYAVANVLVLITIRKSGRSMFKAAMDGITGATFRFYDTTPQGLLLNRAVSDMSAIDGGISRDFQSLLFGITTWISAIVVFFVTSPYFLIVGSLLVLGYVLIFRMFLPCSQSLRRLEMTSLTPFLSTLGVMLEGLTTIRAFHAQSRFQDRVIATTDSFQGPDHFYWSLQAWLSFRLEALSAFGIFTLTVIAIYSNFSAGLTAFVLIAAAKFISSTHSLVKQYGNLQMTFVSVERVVEMMQLEQEPRGSVKPPASWPLPSGDIVFEDVTIRYADHLDPSLSDLSFTIKGGSSTAIIGRTGSGKSTLALALLATVVPSAGEGHISIDGIDISKVDKQTLRQRVTFVAQDPVLFPGTMRRNLDPLDEHSDEECTEILQKVGGSYGWTLQSQVDTGGSNLSQGQRQLIGLSRALLRRSSVIILDEATASIDMATAARIQELIQEELRGSTIITIAHRLEAVRGADYCVELSKGKLVRFGGAEEMLGGGEGESA